MIRIATALFAALLPLDAASMQAEAADRALLIGLDSYADTRLNAKGGQPAGHDVAGIRSLLISKLKYSADNIKVISNAEATHAGILAAIEDWLIKGTHDGERAYLYFAGNGYFTPDDDGDEADGLDEGLVPFDAKVSFADGKLVIDGLVRDDEITAALSRLAGRKVTLVVDAGFSGRVVRKDGGDPTLARAPDIEANTRAITVEPKAQSQKAEGGYLDRLPPNLSLAAWTAVSASQTAMLEAGGGGVFTRLYIEAIGENRADANGNGVVSNAELLTYLTAGSNAYCAGHKATCQLGLTPRLEPLAAHAGAVLPGQAPAVIAEHDKITPNTVTDFLSKGNSAGIRLTQTPSSTVYVGQKDIRFQVISPHDGFLILLNLSDKGELIQLYPNQFSRKHDKEGRIRAGAPLMVPDDYYGIRFNATEPSSGQIIAIIARRKVDWDTAVGTRAIEVIPRKQAVEEVLPKIAYELGTPKASSDPHKNTEPMQWSVATMRYEIKPR